ncbi:hypothetical protein A6A06_03340 [Streptomyces sp. CB02923]|uniref:excalibur calcium-binding domain-containing protein n=1 Tax=Streptomyces sp. CB02923 TaxID=1718985 RepID=UPI000969B3DE|nr:excalibur calcium-binding domain-containing protein [Streptomyces sp. CB02923]OKI09709.1 hypothetical protein A6A06_03340 [Streptomyces sp. CB02923]
MANPYDRSPSSSPSPSPSPSAVARPPWFRRGRVWGLLALGFLFGGCTGALTAGGQDAPERTSVQAADRIMPRATVTVTAPPAKAAPAPTVTVTATVTATARVTVTAAPPPADDAPSGGSDGSGDSGGSGGGAASGGSADVEYANCAAVRAAGAAPIHAGDPGYSRRLDRDGDGVGCER